MPEVSNYIPVCDGLQMINKLVDDAQPPMPAISMEEFFASEQPEPPEHMWVKDEQDQSHLIWQRSLDISWEICASVSKIYVAPPGGEIAEIQTENFCVAPDDKGISSKYFNLLSGRTITENFVAETGKTRRSGSIGEAVYLEAEEFEERLTIVRGSQINLADFAELADALRKNALPNVGTVKHFQTTAELEAAWLEYVKEFIYPDKPNQQARYHWGKSHGITQNRVRILQSQLSPEYWTRPGKIPK